MTEPLNAQESADLLSALAAPERLKIVCFLKDGEKNVTQIAEMLQTAPVNVSHHSSVLKHAGILRSRKVGRFMYYATAPGILSVRDNGRTAHLNLGFCTLELKLQPDEAGIETPAEGIRVDPALVQAAAAKSATHASIEPSLTHGAHGPSPISIKMTGPTLGSGDGPVSIR